MHPLWAERALEVPCRIDDAAKSVDPTSTVDPCSTQLTAPPLSATPSSALAESTTETLTADVLCCRAGDHVLPILLLPMYCAAVGAPRCCSRATLCLPVLTHPHGCSRAEFFAPSLSCCSHSPSAASAALVLRSGISVQEARCTCTLCCNRPRCTSCTDRSIRRCPASDLDRCHRPAVASLTRAAELRETERLRPSDREAEPRPRG